MLVYLSGMNKVEEIQFVLKRREGEPIDRQIDIRKLQRLGYPRSVSFSEGIERSYSGRIDHADRDLSIKCWSIWEQRIL